MAKSQSFVMTGRNCDDSVQIILCCAMTCVCYTSVFCQLAFWLDIVKFHVLICRSYARLSSGFPPHSRISDRKYSMGNIYDSWLGTPLMFFQVDSLTLNTPHTTGKSDKIIFRPTKIIETLPRIVGRGEMGPKSARLSCGVYPALGWEIVIVLLTIMTSLINQIC